MEFPKLKIGILLMLLIGIAPNAYADFTGPPMEAVVGVGIFAVVIIFFYFFFVFRFVRFVQRAQGRSYPKHCWFQSLLMLFFLSVLTFGNDIERFLIGEYFESEILNTLFFILLIFCAFLISGLLGYAITPKLKKNEIE